MRDKKLNEQNQKVIINGVVCTDRMAGSCKHGNELSDCKKLGDILTLNLLAPTTVGARINP